MKRLVILLIGIFVISAGTEALAGKKRQKKKGMKKAAAEVTVAPKSDQIAPMIAEYNWGMTHEDVLKILTKKIEDEYREKMAKAGDPIKEDKLHLTMRSKIKALQESYIEFTGQITGFDSSLVKNEYTHHNDEAMIVFPKDLKVGRKWDDYFLFIGDRLWKIFRAFDAEMFPGLKWQDVQNAMVVKFGADPYMLKKFDEDTHAVHILGLQWQEPKTLMTLLDYTTFYGIFCLRFEDKNMLGQIDSLRVNKPREESKAGIVDAITEGTSSDASADIVDRLTKEKKKETKKTSPGSLPTPKKKKEESSILDDI